MRIPPKKELEPGMSLIDTDYIWDYLEMYTNDIRERTVCSTASDDLEETCNGGDDYDCYDCDYDDSYDWESDYRDAFEDDEEAYWGREW